jgi:hypothetical protein
MYIWVIYNFYEDAEVSNFEEDAEVSNAGVPCLWVFLFPLLLLCWEEGMRGAMWVLMDIVIKPDPSVSKILELIWPNLTRLG